MSAFHLLGLQVRANGPSYGLDELVFNWNKNIFFKEMKKMSAIFTILESFISSYNLSFAF